MTINNPASTAGVNPELLDSHITVTLPASAWQIILSHLELGHALGNVLGHPNAPHSARAIVDALYQQAKPQLDAALTAAAQAMASSGKQHSRTN